MNRMVRSIALALIPLCVLPADAAGNGACELGRTPRDRVRSIDCLTCHDGSVARAVHGALAPGSVGTRDGNHPVEVHVDDAALRRPGRAVGTVMLPAELVLTGGRMTCATCHDARSPEPSRTALPMHGSRMCLACHRV